MRVVTIFLVVAACVAEPGEDPRAPPGTNALEYVVVVTGGELLEGVVADAHTPFLARTLRPLGATCVGVEIVDDRAQDLTEALLHAARRAALVIVTGGLGPTVNDITRETVSGFTGIPLVEDTNVVSELARRLHTTAAAVPTNIRRQARVPARGSFLPNAHGTAVGLVYDNGTAVIVALPGPPRELQPMVRDALVPWLHTRFGVHPPASVLTTRFVGVGQSRLDQILREQVGLPPDLMVSSQFDGSRVDFSFMLPHDGADSREKLVALEKGIRRHLGEWLYATGTTTLEEVATRRIRERGETLALVETGSGGALAVALARGKLTRSLVVGAYSAPEAAQLCRLLRLPEQTWASLPAGAERVREVAQRAREAAGANWVIAVGDSETDSGASLHVWVAAGLPGGRWETRRIDLRDGVETGQTTLVNEVFDWLRRLEP